MKLSQFIDLFVAALYNETELTGQSDFRLGEIAAKYGLPISPVWGESLFGDYAFSSRVNSHRHIGPAEQQHVSLSPNGIRWVEDDLGENVSAFLERNGAVYTVPENVLTTENGEPITTEDGEYITLEESDASSNVSSEAWTGLPRTGVLTPQATEKLKVALRTVDDALEKASCSNEERAQARAYALAIHALADAPEPPADLIWELISRANAIAGIAALFVSLIALFSHG